MKKTNSTAPLAKCSECLKEKPAYGFTIVSNDESCESRELCSACFNRSCARRSGLPDLELPELSPILLIDSLGKEHVFYFDVRLTTGLGIQAFELVDGNPGGYQFSIMDHPASDVSELYFELIKKIKTGLSVHYLQASVFGDQHSKLYIHGSAITGRIEEKDSAPSVVVDGREYSWEQLGAFLSSYSGFNFRLECFDPYDEIETDPNPKRPDPLWWLEPREDKDTEPRRFQ